jgi:hypothetical protein
MKLALLGAALLVAAAHPADASCAYIETVDQLVSGDGILALDGAILIGHGPRGPGPKHAPKAEDWKVVDGSGAPVDVKIVELAPGIRAFVRAKPGKPATKIVVKDDAGDIGTFTNKDVKLELTTAPSGSNARVTTAQAFRGMSTTFQLDLASVPDAATYVVITGKRGNSSAAVVPHATGATTVMPFTSGGHCGGRSAGAAPDDGEELTLAWMDRYGRMGPTSKSIRAANRP